MKKKAEGSEEDFFSLHTHDGDLSAPLYGKGH